MKSMCQNVPLSTNVLLLPPPQKKGALSHLETGSSASSYLEKGSSAPSYLEKGSNAPSHLERGSSASSHLEMAKAKPLVVSVDHPSKQTEQSILTLHPPL